MAGILRNFKKTFNNAKGALTYFKSLGKKSNPYNSQAFGDFNTQTFSNDTQELDSYKLAAWVAIAVDRISRDAGNQNFFFVDNRSNEVVKTQRVDQAILEPLQNGFAGLSFIGGLLPIAIIHRKLTGNAYWLKAKTSDFGLANNMTENFIPLLPGNVTVKLNKSGSELIGYQLKLPEGNIITFSPDQIIHFRENPIYNPFVGVGTIERMRLTISGEVASEEFHNSFMSNRATPSIAITTEESFDENSLKRYATKLKQQFEGTGNAGKMMFLAGKGMDVKTLQLSQKDMQFLEQKKYNRQTVLSMFGVPPVVAGIPDGANKAIADSMRLNYLQNTINDSELKLLEQVLNSEFVHPINPNLSIKFTRHATGDVENVSTKLMMGAINPNRASELLGEPVDLTDESRNTFYMPQNMVPIDFFAGDMNPPDPAKSKTEQDHKNCGHVHHGKSLSDPKNVDQICDYYEKRIGGLRGKFQVQFLRASLKRRNNIEDRFTFLFSKYFKDQGKRILANYDEFLRLNNIEKSMKLNLSDSEAIDFIFDIKAENAFLEPGLTSTHTSGVQGSIKDINHITGRNVSASLANPFVKSTIERLGKITMDSVDKYGKTRGINIATKRILANIIGRGVADGLTTTDIQENIAKRFTKFRGSRARIIARTEGRAAWDAGAKISYTELGVKTIDVIGCDQTSVEASYGTMTETSSDCGVTGVPMAEMGSLDFHPNHLGAVVPSEAI